ncbi:MAG: double-strand break repair protein AddB [Ancalomicrobiaceae bacterium]|nr:double-strand break repair protein AddB [Ancalomicrobiaceae bacterium]
MADGLAAMPRLFSIDPTRPFLPTLVDALVDGRIIPGFRPLDDPLMLGEATILLPTRRAARALREAFLERFGGRAVILPRILAVGDVDDDGLGVDADAADSLDPPLDQTERLLAMTRLVLEWRDSVAATLLNPVTGQPPTVPSSPGDAVYLAQSLLRLMDQMASEGADWTKLKTLVPEEHAEHWELTLAFLQLVAAEWPRLLAATGRADPIAHRDALVRAEAARLAAHPPTAPIIAAGSTGSIPATAALLDVVARLPKGAVVLPGLDRFLDADGWQAIGSDDDPDHAPVAGHPQYGLKLLLRRLRADRTSVEALTPESDAALVDRLQLLSEAMRPAETTDRWRDLAERLPQARREAALAGVSLIAARSEPEEALAIALAMRETLETPGHRAALVTPDRNLARRVAVELARWGLAVDDSAGTAFALTPPAVFARLVVEVALEGYDCVSLVALMQHPLAAFGLARRDARHRARMLEIAALRGPRPRSGSRGLLAALEAAEDEVDDKAAHPPAARRRLKQADWEEARDLASRIAAALKPLEDLADRRSAIDLADLLDAHVAVLEAATATPGEEASGLFDGEAGETLATSFAQLMTAAKAPTGRLRLAPSDYSGFIVAALGEAPVRRRGTGDARLAIWGPLEARLQAVDRLILGGLNEGIWPNAAKSDPWLSRPMRADVGLEAPERRVGLSAHDVAQGMAARHVILTRSAKARTAPTVASRWLQRLATVAGEGPAAAIAARGERFLLLARQLDRRGIARIASIARPAPCPPVEARPTRLPVTAIETWIRDPYALYARHILRLEPLEAIGAAPDASDRGMLVHDVLARFVATWNGISDETALAELLRHADDRLKDFAAFPEIVALWRPRFEKIAAFVLTWEAGRTAKIARRLTEVSGQLDIAVAGAEFRLVARADRIDVAGDGSCTIFDYKTGRPPTQKQVMSLLAPQLPLEAAMLVGGGFGPAPARAALAALTYLHLSGNGDGGAVATVAADPPAKPDLPTPAELGQQALDRLKSLIAAFRNPATPYPSRPRIQFEAAIGGPYDHLARVKEWAAGEEGES